MATPMQLPYHSGIDIGTIVGESVTTGEWAIDVAKSSRIELIPTSGIIRKEKRRRLDKTIYEAHATLFFSEWLKQYNQILQNADFTLYAPEVVALEYGIRGDSFLSAIAEFFCPGASLQKLFKGKEDRKEKKYAVQGEAVRAEERVMYLAGVIYEMFRREGVIHGDPQLRHFLLLPERGRVYELDRDMTLHSYDPRNGLGIIDCERARIEGAESEGVVKEADKFKERVFNKFTIPGAEGYFERGRTLIQGLDGFYARENAQRVALSTLHSRFDERIKDVNMEEQRVIF